MSKGNQELWQARVNDYYASNKSARKWCEENSISPSSLKYWLIKLNEEQTSSTNDPEFVPISTETTENNSSSSATIRIGRISIDISNECQPRTIKTILEALNSYV